MKILYVAKFGNHDNCDEEAIAYALEKLGHEVVKVHEMRRYRTRIDQDLLGSSSHLYDFCLFHKWETVSEITALTCPRVFWYFDLLSNNDDPTLAIRMQTRRRWFHDVIPHCITAFCTDGDWVKNWNNTQSEHAFPTIRWLMQGADERYVGLGESVYWEAPEILFTGTRHHGQKREEHIRQLEARYGSRFSVVGETRASPRVHQRTLANLFASVKVVVAPDGPCTDRYWSNRVYLTAGLGGYLIHPHLTGLQSHYSPAEVHQYRDRDELCRMIDYALENPGEVLTMRMIGHLATVRRNLYRHRCEQLINVVRGLM